MMLNKLKLTEIGMIPEDWDVKELSELGEIKTGKGTKKLDSGKYKIIGSNGFLGYTNDEEFLEEGPLIFTGRVGTIGQINYFPNQKIWLSDNTIYFKTNDKILLNFIYYFLRKYDFSFLNVGSTQPLVKQSDFKKLLIALPKNKREIQTIAKILFDLDSKIELNQQMNKILEAIGQAIFRRWFVDFEFPNEKGKSYKSSGEEMVESELGEIPKGWKVGKLGDNGIFKNGINYLRGETGDTEFFIANVRDIANNKLLLKDSLDKIKIDLKKAKAYLLNDKDILIARSASPGEISLVLGNLEKVIYSGFSIRYRLSDPNNFLYFFLILQGLKENLLNFSIGTTLQSVNQETLKNMKFILPSNDVLKEFNKIIEQILDKTYNNLMQNSEISQIRDSLLPRLMSGKIRVPVNGED